jgi:hypothetical protein
MMAFGLAKAATKEPGVLAMQLRYRLNLPRITPRRSFYLAVGGLIAFLYRSTTAFRTSMILRCVLDLKPAPGMIATVTF